jgi:hypothetical protein
MYNQIFDRTPKTLREHNQSVLVASDIMSGKEFRRMRRKKVKNNSIKVW